MLSDNLIPTVLLRLLLQSRPGVVVQSKHGSRNLEPTERRRSRCVDLLLRCETV